MKATLVRFIFPPSPRRWRRSICRNPAPTPLRTVSPTSMPHSGRKQTRYSLVAPYGDGPSAQILITDADLLRLERRSTPSKTRCWLPYFSLAMRVEVPANRAFAQRRWASRIVLVARERRAADHSEVRERGQTVASTVAVGAARAD